MDDYRECANCEESVVFLSSRDWCDGCEEEAYFREQTET